MGQTMAVHQKRDWPEAERTRIGQLLTRTGRLSPAFTVILAHAGIQRLPQPLEVAGFLLSPE
jgi:hypothetical protein